MVKRKMTVEERIHDKAEELERLKKRREALEKEQQLDRAIDEEQKKIERVRPRKWYENMFRQEED